MNDSIATRITEDEVAPVLAAVRAGIEQRTERLEHGGLDPRRITGGVTVPL